HLLANGHEEAVQMGIARHDAVAVADIDDAAITVLVPGEHDHPGGGAVDRGLVGRAQIDTAVEGGATVEGIWPLSEAALDLVMRKRRRERQALPQLLQFFAAALRIGGRVLDAGERDVGTALSDRRGTERAEQPV